MTSKDLNALEHGAIMHDVGKLGIPDSIMLKPAPLTPEETAIMQTHTTIGARLLADSASPLLAAGAVIALSHHEKWDGTGYPNGLKGDEIPLFGRICAIADVFDALVSERPYKKSMTVDQAIEFMQAQRDKHFDGRLLDIFIASRNELMSAGADAPKYAAPALQPPMQKAA
jgi:putative two-component system response regulator